MLRGCTSNSSEHSNVYELYKLLLTPTEIINKNTACKTQSGEYCITSIYLNYKFKPKFKLN